VKKYAKKVAKIAEVVATVVPGPHRRSGSGDLGGGLRGHG
jgi:hypothetical protein